MKHVFKHVWLAVLLLLSHSLFSQYSVTFKPNAAAGQDAMILRNDDCPSWQTTNYPNGAEVDAFAWTWYASGCGPGAGRSLVRFDGLNTLPAGAVITYAELRLFGVASSGNAQGNSSYPGSPFGTVNTSLVRRVTSAWNENTVTWATQPTITSVDEAVVPASSTQWNYNVSLDVTNQVINMIAPGANNGFMLMLKTEAYYRSMLFASSDNADPARWPELFVKYDLPCQADFAYWTHTNNAGFYYFKVDPPQPGFSYKWSFGDGATASGPSTTHTYLTGSYEVCLIAYNEETGEKCEKCVKICVQNDQPDTCRVRYKFETPNSYLYYFYGVPTGPYPVADAKWDFGDGSTSGDWPDAKHEYTKSGTYEVCLTVKYENGCVAKYCHKVEVRVPCAVSYEEHTDNGYDFKFHGIPGSPSPVVDAKWDFGDGTTADGWPDTDHHYSTPGAYTVCVEVKYENGCVAKFCKEIIVGCGVKFRTQTENGYLYYFYGVPAGPYPVVSAEWDFGDGATSNDWRDTKHEYARSGTYEVCLTVKYENGCVAKYCRKIDVVVPCDVKFKTETPNGHLYYFYGLGVGVSPVASAYWDFGDGTSSTDWPNTKHDYERPGVYKVCLTVKYENGCEARYCYEIRVILDGCSVKFAIEQDRNIFVFRGEAFSSSGAPVASAEWSFGDGRTSNDWPDTKNQYEEPGSYTVCVKVKFEDGCEAKYCWEVVVTAADFRAAGRQSYAVGEKIKVLPNPVNADAISVVLDVADAGNYNYTVYDANGSAALTGVKTLRKGMQTVEVRIAGTAPGNYWIAFTNNKNKSLRTGFIRL